MMRLVLAGLLVQALGASLWAPIRPIVVSSMSRTEALSNQRFPKAVLESQTVVSVRYYSFDGCLHQGQIVVHRSLRREIVAIFKDIERSRAPIGRVIPISKYGWSDIRSMNANNSSGFNYRQVAETLVLSDHALGQAVDINPIQNPDTGGPWAVPPYRARACGAITRNSPIYRAFTKRGWKWGGNWNSGRDYQHFYKP